MEACSLVGSTRYVRLKERTEPWQERLPQRVHGIQSVMGANEFLREQYLAEFNRRFTVPAAQSGHAFIPVGGKNLDLVFSLQPRTDREPGQYRANRPVHPAARENQVASHAGRMPRDRLPALGWNLEYRLRPPRGGTLQPRRSTAAV